jgi:hypothetical protein
MLVAGARCRGCGSLSYRSQRQRPEERALRMAEAISARLGGVAYDHLPDKPARMHRTTYERLQQRHESLVGRVEAAERIASGHYSDLAPYNKRSGLWRSAALDEADGD